MDNVIDEVNVIEKDIEDTKKNVIKSNVRHYMRHSMQFLN